MFWILRRTGAVNFFNSINNNYTSKSNSTITNNSYKSNQRPARGAYGKLNVEADETNPLNRGCLSYQDEDEDEGNCDDHIINIENNTFIPNQNCSNNINNNNNIHKSASNNSDITHSTNINMDNVRNDNINNNNIDSNLNGNLLSDIDVNFNEGDLELTLSKASKDNTGLSRLQTIAISDDEDYDESLTCNVCDRAFPCKRQLASHQQKKRHFGCNGCDSLFSSLMLLEHHKEEFEHWSDFEEDSHMPCCRRNRRDDEFTDTDSITSDAESEDLERLL